MVLDKKWIAAVVVVILAAGGTVGLLVFTGSGLPQPLINRAPAAEMDAEVEIPQAPWRVKTYPAGMGQAPRRAHWKAVKKQKKRLGQAVTAVIDALVLHPESLRKLSGDSLSRPAAKALMRSDLPVPKKVEDVRTMKRQARIGLDHRGSKRAAAGVTVRLRAQIEGKRVRLQHRTTLYLQKRDGRWQVIAFDGTRRRLG